MQDDLQQAITSYPDGVNIRVYVAPRSSANSLIGLHNGELKVTLTAPPVDGAANKALIEFITKKLGVPKRMVSILSGETSRHKVVAVKGVDTQAALDKLGGG